MTSTTTASNQEGHFRNTEKYVQQVNKSTHGRDAVIDAVIVLSSLQKYNVFVSHLGCAAVGVAALTVFGPGWVARAFALAAAIAFMQYTGSLHPPAAGLPLLLIDGQRMHHLQWWFVIYPGAVGCVFLFLLQEVVEFLKNNWRF